MLNIIKNVINNRFKRDYNSKEISKQELNNYIRQGAIIIDVRSPQEYREGHIDGAICIPDYKIKKEIQKRIMDKNQIIIVYCSTGSRSRNVQNVLQKLGYIKVYNLII